MALICVDGDGFRGVNNREKEALRFTFGNAVGKCLIDIIKVEYDPNLIRRVVGGMVKDKVKGETNKAHISMRPNYNPGKLLSLGRFIHEATHIWQRNTGLRGEGKGGENYEYYDEQLLELKLEKEEHASAVQDWFNVKYGTKRGLVDLTNKNVYRYIWTPILEAFGYDPQRLSSWSPEALQELLEVWRPVIREIRDPSKFPECPRGLQLKLGLLTVGA